MIQRLSWIITSFCIKCQCQVASTVLLYTGRWCGEWYSLHEQLDQPGPAWQYDTATVDDMFNVLLFVSNYQWVSHVSQAIQAVPELTSRYTASWPLGTWPYWIITDYKLSQQEAKLSLGLPNLLSHSRLCSNCAGSYYWSVILPMDIEERLMTKLMWIIVTGVGWL